MAFDPLSALSLAANVVQFIDFSSRLISKAQELHKSQDGLLVEHRDFEVISRRLVSLHHGLQTSLSKVAQKQNLTVDEIALHEVSLECKAIAETFQLTLNNFLAEPGQKRWKSFHQAFKAVWYQDGLEAMYQRLARQRELLIIHVLVVVSNRQTANLNELLDGNAQLETRILEAIEKSSAELKSDLISISKRVKKRKLRSKPPASKKVKLLQNDLDIWLSVNHMKLKEISDGISGFEAAGRMADQFLATLSFRQIQERRLQIHKAHAKTFSWIFQRSSMQTLPYANFMEWIESDASDTNLYWVAGKPGSGKSTLMRYLLDAPETHEGLTVWAAGRSLLVASHFFWLAGTQIQKSLNGMLRSLLYDLLSQDVSLMAKISPWRWRALTYNAISQPDWTNTELIDALTCLVGVTQNSHRIYLLIDGLDEYDGGFDEHKKLADTLMSISRAGNIKICVASRPWPIFQSIFGTCPLLRLEMLTRKDIETYVDDIFSKIPGFQTLIQVDPNKCKELTLDIVMKAQGVFLWVYLVTKSLTEGIIEGDTIPELFQRLYAIPGDLEEFFKRIIEGIPPEYRRQATLYFRIMLTLDTRPSVLSLSFLDEETDFLDKLPTKPATVEETEARQRNTTRRLEARTKSLLEVNEYKVEEWSAPFRNLEVDFIHRTVRDFLESKAAQVVLEEYPTNEVDAYTCLCTAILAQMKLINVGAHYSQQITRKFLPYAAKLDRLSGVANCELVDRYRDLLKQPAHDKDWASPESFIALVLSQGLDNYAAEKLSSENFNLSAAPTYLFNQPLLPRRNLLEWCILTRSNKPLEKSIEVLLDRGCSPNWKSASSHSAWEYFVLTMADRKYADPDVLNDPVWPRIARLFIQHGAYYLTRTSRENNVVTPWLEDGLKDVRLSWLLPGEEGKELERLLQKNNDLEIARRQLAIMQPQMRPSDGSNPSGCCVCM